MELSEMTAERVIAGLIMSNGGELRLLRKNMEIDYNGLMLQVSETGTGDAFIFRLVEAGDVELDGTE